MIDDDSLETLAIELHRISRDKFTGQVIINFYKGGIAGIKKEYSEKIDLIIVKRYVTAAPVATSSV